MSTQIESYRGAVATWECDHYGHMNVQFYMARISDAAAPLLAAIGLDSLLQRQQGLGFAALHQEIDYRRELHAGDVIVMQSHVAAIEGKKLIFGHRLYNAATGALAMEARVLGVLLDLAARRAVEIPAGIGARAASLIPAGIPAPAADLLAANDGWIASERSCVNPWECDRMGHLNVQFHVARFATADRHVAAAIGLSPAEQRSARMALLPETYRIQFRRELHAGATTAMRSGIRGAGDDRIETLSVMNNAESGTVSAVAEASLRLTDLDTSDPRPLPDHVRRRAETLASEFRGDPALPPQGPPAPGRPVPGMFETARSSLNTWETDWHGFATPRFYMSVFSDAASHMLDAVGLGGDALRRRGWGSAALDYRIRFGRPLRAGDAVMLKSAVLEVREKVWRFCHLMLDARSEDVVAAAEIVALVFDLGTRKSFPIPDDIKAQAEARRITPAPTGG